MNSTGLRLLIDQHFPDLMSFNENKAVMTAEKLIPKAVFAVRRHFREGGELLSTSQLANIFTQFNRESREDRLNRIRDEVKQHWVNIGLIDVDRETIA